METAVKDVASQSHRDLVAEIGRLTLQVDAGSQEANSPLKRKVAQALNYSKDRDVASIDTAVSNMSFAPVAKILEENSKLRQDLMQSKREVLRCKMEAQEHRIRIKDLEGRHATEYTAVPWNRKKLEMQQIIDELQSQLQLSRKAHHLYSRSETDKLRIKATEMESRWKETAKSNAELKQECMNLRNTVAQLEGVAESLTKEKEAVLSQAHRAVSVQLSRTSSHTSLGKGGNSPLRSPSSAFPQRVSTPPTRTNSQLTAVSLQLANKSLQSPPACASNAPADHTSHTSSTPNRHVQSVRNSEPSVQERIQPAAHAVTRWKSAVLSPTQPSMDTGRQSTRHPARRLGPKKLERARISRGMSDGISYQDSRDTVDTFQDTSWHESLTSGNSTPKRHVMDVHMQNGNPSHSTQKANHFSFFHAFEQ